MEAIERKVINRFFNLLLFSFLLNSMGAYAQVYVDSLSELQSAVQNSNQNIVMTPGDYDLEDLPSSSRIIDCSGSNNTINLTGVHVQVTVGIIRTAYFLVTGNNNTLIGGEFEDVYGSGITEVTDFVAYNQNNSLAYGLRGAAVMEVSGADNLVDGIKLTPRGSFPYGYGSMYGINATNTFGLNKRCGLLINGPRNTLDNVEVQHRAFGHGIYMQGDADETVIKNCLVEGRVRSYDELYEETDSNSLPSRAQFKHPSGAEEEDISSSFPDMPRGDFFSLCEDGIRAYNGTGSVTVENCTVKKMRGGIRLYLGGDAKVTNTTAIDCGATNWNMPNGGEAISSSGNFAYAPLSDFRLGRSNMDLEWTIIPSPHASGAHNLMDLLGNNHNVVLHRTPGPIDETDRAIVVTGDNSTIVNETEYRIILESGASGNNIISCGPVTDNGSNNDVIINSDCENVDPCDNTTELIEAECYDNMFGIQSEPCIEGGLNIGYINSNDWVVYNDIDLSNTKSIQARVASNFTGGTIEVRLNNVTGALIGSLPVTNTGGNQSWVTLTENIDNVTGIQDVCLVFKGGADYLFNINSFGFLQDTVLSVNDNEFARSAISIFPNPVVEVARVKQAMGLTMRIYDISGEALFTKEISSESEVIDLSGLAAGIYYAQIYNSQKLSSIKKIVKR